MLNLTSPYLRRAYRDADLSNALKGTYVARFYNSWLAMHHTIIDYTLL
jgi:hypothetical protein